MSRLASFADIPRGGTGIGRIAPFTLTQALAFARSSSIVLMPFLADPPRIGAHSDRGEYWVELSWACRPDNSAIEFVLAALFAEHPDEDRNADRL